MCSVDCGKCINVVLFYSFIIFEVCAVDNSCDPKCCAYTEHEVFKAGGR